MAITLGVGEIIEMVAMIFASAYIFMDFFPMKTSETDPVKAWKKQRSFKAKFLDSILLVSIPILLHEAGHKIVASLFGLQATFQAAWLWLGLGVFLKLVAAPFIFLIPAYVQIVGATTPLQQLLISFAGPAVHLLFFLGALVVERTVKLDLRKAQLVRYTKLINGFLFVFNMLPIPPFDGFKFFSALIAMLF